MRGQLTIVNLIPLSMDKHHVIGERVVILDDIRQVYARFPALVHRQMIRSNERCIVRYWVVGGSVGHVDYSLPVRQELSDPICRCLIFCLHRGDDRFRYARRCVVDRRSFGERFKIVQMRQIELFTVRCEGDYDQSQDGASWEERSEPWSTE